jgi:glyoxylase-like metal-dependent hydrolase (beta-lactamase superfamily II)
VQQPTEQTGYRTPLLLPTRLHRHGLLLVWLICSLFIVGCATTSRAADTPDERQNADSENSYAIDKVAGDLYRFTAGKYRSVFLVSSEGILLTDPIDREAARWLRRELGERFDAPVRYLVYSHDHPDHVYGGDIFNSADVTIVSHQMARASLERTKADTAIPDMVFQDQMTLHLGEHDVQLTYHGPNNGRGSISMLFQKTDVLFVVDWIVLGRTPYKTLPGYDLPGMIASTREVLEMPFETFVGGHARTGDKQDIRRYLSYLTDLQAGVIEGIRAGHSLDEITKNLTLDAYSDFAHFDDWRPLNIEGAYREFVDEAYMLRRTDVPSPNN